MYFVDGKAIDKIQKSFPSVLKGQGGDFANNISLAKFTPWLLPAAAGSASLLEILVEEGDGSPHGQGKVDRDVVVVAGIEIQFHVDPGLFGLRGQVLGKGHRHLFIPFGMVELE